MRFLEQALPLGPCYIRLAHLWQGWHCCWVHWSPRAVESLQWSLLLCVLVTGTWSVSWRSKSLQGCVPLILNAALVSLLEEITFVAWIFYLVLPYWMHLWFLQVQGLHETLSGSSALGRVPWCNANLPWECFSSKSALPFAFLYDQHLLVLALSWHPEELWGMVPFGLSFPCFCPKTIVLKQVSYL